MELKQKQFSMRYELGQVLCVATCRDQGLTSAPLASDNVPLWLLWDVLPLLDNCLKKILYSLWWKWLLLRLTFQLVPDIFSWWQIRESGWRGQAVNVSDLEFIMHDSGNMRMGTVLLQHKSPIHGAKQLLQCGSLQSPVLQAGDSTCQDNKVCLVIGTHASPD